MRAAHILCIGGANLDIKSRLIGLPTGSSDPAAIKLSAGGVARNVAHNLALLGHDAHLMTVLGKGLAADLIQQQSAPGLHFDHIHGSPEHPSGIYCAILDKEGELLQAASQMDAMDSLTPDRIAALWKQDFDFIFADTNLSPQSLEYVTERSRSRPLLLDAVSAIKAPKIQQIKNKAGIMLKANRQELRVLTGIEDLGSACHSLHDQGVRFLLIGLGQEGALISDGQGLYAFVASKTHSITDVTGAGDAAAAGFIHGLLQDWPLLKAAEFSQEIAALACKSQSSTLDNISHA